MIYIVLGCHKSGTTLVARTLHESGIAMVGDEDTQGEYDESGFYERLRWVELNQRILGHGDPAEDHPIAAKVFATEREREQMRDWIAGCESRHGDWGFKDPRTCLTYPIWREELPEHRVIGVYRPLTELWSRYSRTDWRHRSLFKVMRLWIEYNRRLADVLEERQRHGQKDLLLRYDSLMKDRDEHDRLSPFLGRSVADARDPKLHRASQRGRRRIAVLDYLLGQAGRPQAGRVWERLERLRESQVRGQRSGSGGAP